MARIGLVLGGGGLTGTAFHAGVLTALAEDLGLDARSADVIVGTSAGSTAAALTRAGFPPQDYVNRMTGEPVSAEGQRVLANMRPIGQPPSRPPWQRRPAAPDLLRRIARQPWKYPVGTMVAAALPAGTVDVRDFSPGFGPLFHHWPQRPTWLTAVSLRTGRRVVFGRDARASIPDAVAASCAIPGYFRPVEIDGELFVDGGMHSSHHVDLMVGLGLDLVIVSAPLATTDWVASDIGNAVRVPVRRQLEREIDRLAGTATRVVVIAPVAPLRRLMGTNSMVVSKRPGVAVAVRAHVRHRIEDGLLN